MEQSEMVINIKQVYKSGYKFTELRALEIPVKFCSCYAQFDERAQRTHTQTTGGIKVVSHFGSHQRRPCCAQMHRNSSAIAVATLALRDTCLSCALPSVTTILIIYPSLQPAISIFAAATAAAAIELKNNVVSHSHLVRFLSLLHHSVHVAVWCAVLPCP